MANSDVHDVVERLYDFRTMTLRPMTLVLSTERTEAGVREALFAHRTLALFYNTVMGKEEWLEKFFHASIDVQPPHQTTPERRFMHVKNKSDVPFILRRTDPDAKRYPDKIEIPAQQSVLLILPNEPAPKSVAYEVENMIVTPEKKLQVSLGF
jgi:hypothetical protein